MVRVRGMFLLEVISHPATDKAEVVAGWKIAQQMERDFWLNLDRHAMSIGLEGGR